MAKKQESTSAEGSSSELFQRLAALKNPAGGMDIEQLDARLLWKVTTILAKRGASIQVGVTRDNSAWAVQYWDGKFPVKDYYRSTDEFNRSMAALVRADGGRGLSPEWEAIVSEYGW